jgi:hypothetical protein
MCDVVSRDILEAEVRRSESDPSTSDHVRSKPPIARSPHLVGV